MSTAPAPQPETVATPAAAPVADNSAKPKGVIPKTLQSFVWLAALLLVAIGIFFSGSTTKKPSPSGNPTQAAAPTSASGLTPEQVQKRLQDSEEQARRAAPNQLQQAALQQGQQPQPGDPLYNPDAAFLAANQPPAAPTRDPIQEEDRKREYFGRYASNIAVSYRTSGRSLTTTSSAAPGASDLSDAASSNSVPSLPADFQKQLQALQAQQEQLLAASQQQLAAATAATAATTASAGPPGAAATTSAAVLKKPTSSNNSSTGKNHVIFEGTLLESVLVNRLNGDFAGPVVCQITTDLYSNDHSTLLIPAGTRVLGETKKIDSLGQTRLAVIFHRFIMPDGYSVDLDQAPALNQIGETALHDKVNNHYIKIFGASIAIGALAGLSAIGTNNSAVTGLPVSTSDSYRQGVAASLSQSSLHILDKFLNIPPTITIHEGHRVRIFLTQDLEVPAYVNHTMPSNL